MKYLDAMISRFDALTLRFSSDQDLKQREEEFRNEIPLYANAANRLVNEAYDSVDTKATAILQHVSIMIAVSGLLYSQAASFLRFFFVGEMLLYIILALYCLRLLMMQHVSPAYSDVQNAVCKEAVLDLTAKLTFLVSVALVLTVVAEVLVK
ncbi:MAG: hypothetical protein EKK33_32745 [Bradyrhizobiaceae bacterium]|nr:MAG: hypothetical protein EKK33_32745 [Bradyrhizobiaceae bacterium]